MDESLLKKFDLVRGVDESLLEKFGLLENQWDLDPASPEPTHWANHKPEDPFTDDTPYTKSGPAYSPIADVGESLMLKYGFMSESTAKLFEKFGLLIDEANLSPEEKEKVKKEVDREYKEEFKDKLKEGATVGFEDLSTPDTAGVPSVEGTDQENKPKNPMADKGDRILDKKVEEEKTDSKHQL